MDGTGFVSALCLVPKLTLTKQLIEAKKDVGDGLHRCKKRNSNSWSVHPTSLMEAFRTRSHFSCHPSEQQIPPMTLVMG